MPKDDRPISSMTGPELLDYLNILSQRMSEYSDLLVNIIEKLKPVEQERSTLRLSKDKVLAQIRQTKVEVAACKYALKAEANS